MAELGRFGGGSGSRAILMSALLALVCACAQSPSPVTDDGPVPIVARPVRSAAECVPTLRAYAVDSTFGEHMQPQILRLHLPDFSGGRYSGRIASVRIRVDTAGRVDSVVVGRATNKRFIAAIRRATLKNEYRPATVDDCAVVGWVTMFVTPNVQVSHR